MRYEPVGIIFLFLDFEDFVKFDREILSLTLYLLRSKSFGRWLNGDLF